MSWNNIKNKYGNVQINNTNSNTSNNSSWERIKKKYANMEVTNSSTNTVTRKTGENLLKNLPYSNSTKISKVVQRDTSLLDKAKNLISNISNKISDGINSTTKKIANTSLDFAESKRTNNEYEKYKVPTNNTEEQQLVTQQAVKQTQNAEQKVARKNSIESYNQAKKEREAQALVTDEQLLENLSKMSGSQRVAEIYNITKNNDDFNRLNNQVIQYQTMKKATEKANKINEDMTNGNYLSAIGHVAAGVPVKARDSLTTTMASINSLADAIGIVNVPTNSYIKSSGDDLLKTNKAVTSEYGQTTSQIDNGAVRTAANVSGTIGSMTPSIAASMILPGAGRVLQGVQVGADSYQENLNDDGSNRLRSVIAGAAKGYTSYALEGLTGGNVLSSGSLDDWAVKTIASKTSNKSLQKLASMVYEVGGEVLEEEVENNVDYVIDKVINNKDLPDFKDWWSETSETAKQTILSTLALKVLGLGGNTYKDVQEYSQNAEMNKWISEAEQIIEKENLKIDSEKLQQKNNINELLSQLAQNQQNTSTQQITPTIQNNVQNGISEQNNSILSNKEVPMLNYQYEKSDNVKINNLRQDANRYFNNSEKARNYVSMLERIITDKNIDIRLDADLKTPDGKVANGSYSNGVITINPNSTRAGEFIAVHELTHAIGNDSMKNIIETYRQSNPEFNTAVEKLLQNYNSTEITEEALSDVSAQLFGNQEFINNVAQTNPNIFKKIYSEIKYLWHQFRGYKNQDQFVEDLYYKWTQAYNSSNKLNETGNYYIEPIANFNETEYNNIIEEKLTKKEYAILRSIINSDSNIKPGINYIEVTNGRYTVYYKGFDDFKVMSRKVDTDAGRINKRNDTTGRKARYSKTFEQSFGNERTTTSNDEISNINTQGTRERSGSDTSSSTNIENVKYSIQESENNSGSFFNSEDFKKYILPEIKERHQYENKNKITETIEELKKRKETLDIDTDEGWDNNFIINQKIKALENGYDTIYDYLIEHDINELKKDYKYNPKILTDKINRVKQTEKKQEKLQKEIEEATPIKRAQYEIIQKTNPMFDDEHVGIRSPADIKTFEEAIQDEGSFSWGDYTKEDAERDLKRNKVKIYSSYAIKNGVFVSTSYQQALDYAGGDRAQVHSKEISPNRVAWINGDEGQYASINAKYFIENQTWQSYLDKNYKATGTRTNLQDIKNIAPIAKDVKNNNAIKKAPVNTLNMQVQQEKVKAPISGDVKVPKTLNPTEISNLKPSDASTTPKLPNINYEKGNKQSSFFGNVVTDAKFLNQDLRQELGKEDNIRYYKGITNQETLEKAYNNLNKDGEKATLNWISKDTKNINAEDVAKGWILLKQYQDNGDYQGAVEIAKKMRQMATEAGQTVQAYNILSRLTPEGMFYYAQSELTEAYNKMVEGKSQKWIEENRDKFELTPTETQFIMDNMKDVANMENGYDKKVKIAEIQSMLKNKIPPTTGQSIKAWMRISMLFNPKTQFRNVLGNAVVLPVNIGADVIASGVDKLISKKTGVRTTGNFNIKNYSKGFGQGLYESYNDFKKGINTREIEGNRFEISEGKSFKDKGIGKALNRVDNLLSFMLDAGDRGFYEATFTNSINNQLVLNNTTEVTQDMIDIATNEALQRTWQDNNAYTGAVLGLRNILNGKIDFAGIHTKGLSYGLGDIIMPFAKTPANLTKAIVDYSPIGLATTLAIDARKLKNSFENGQYTPELQHKFVQNLGKATAGSFLYVLGYALAKAGITSGEADDDKDVKNFMKNSLGISSYSIKIGDKTFTYDWAQPVATPFAFMANLEKKRKDNPNNDIMNAIGSVINTGTDILFKQSFMDSVNNVLNGNGTFAENLMQTVLELPARAVPTFSKQIADMVDGTQRTSFEYDKPVQSAINSVVAKIPVASKTLPVARDTLGNEIKKYGGENNLFNVMFNPANVNKGQLSKAGEEIYRLYKETGETGVFPITAPYYINSDGEKITMTAEERSNYQKITGEYSEKAIKELLNNATYKSLSDEKKAEFIKDIISDSNAKAKYDILDIESDKAKEKRELIEKINTKNYYDYKMKTKDIEGKDATRKKNEVLLKSNYSNNVKEILYQNTTGKDDKVYQILKKLDSNKNIINQYLDYLQADLEADREDDGTEKGKAISGTKKKKVSNYINSIDNKDMSYVQKLYLAGINTTLSSSEKKKLFTYINENKSLTSKEKMEALDKLQGFTVYKNGKVKW